MQTSDAMRRENAKSYLRRMSRAKRNPSPSAPALMGIASLHPSYRPQAGLPRFAGNDTLKSTAPTQQQPEETPMLTLHHLNDSRSQRILWLLEELGTPYEMKRYQRNAETRLAPPELEKVHPLGKSPVIIDGDVRIAESGAIVDYIIRRYGKGAMMP